jgi:isocitrate/isopropylmalate dehydrogenase
VQMMLDHLGFKSEGLLIEAAVRECIREDECTPDIGGKLGTREAGDAVCRRIRELA